MEEEQAETWEIRMILDRIVNSQNLFMWELKWSVGINIIWWPLTQTVEHFEFLLRVESDGVSFQFS